MEYFSAVYFEAQVKYIFRKTKNEPNKFDPFFVKISLEFY